MFTVKAFAKDGTSRTGWEAVRYDVTTPTDDKTQKAVLRFDLPGGGSEVLHAFEYSRIVVENATGKTVENINLGVSVPTHKARAGDMDGYAAVLPAAEKDQSENTGNVCAAALIPAAA